MRDANEIDFDAIIEKRKARAPQDEKRRQEHLVKMAVRAKERDKWRAIRDRVRDKASRGEAPSPDEIKQALANPDTDLERARLIANAKARMRKAVLEGSVPSPADIMLAMSEDED